jgi:hypothetical protein
MSTQYRLVQSGKTASGGCSAGQGSSEPVAPRIFFIFLFFIIKRIRFLIQSEWLEILIRFREVLGSDPRLQPELLTTSIYSQYNYQCPSR